MSSLPHTNGEAAREWVQRAALRYDIGVMILREVGDIKEAVKAFTSAAELALKAVYIEQEEPYPRTHDIGYLVQACPDQTVQQVLKGYSENFVKQFTRNYLAPYVQAKPMPMENAEECRKFAERIIKWAEFVIII